MPKIDTMRPSRPTRPGCFSSCFGRAAPADIHELDLAKLPGSKKRQRWSAELISWSRTFLKKKGVVKVSVVPVDAAGDPWCSARCCKAKKWGSAKFNEPNKLPSATSPTTQADTPKKPARKSIGSNPSSPAKRHTAPLPSPPQRQAGQLDSGQLSSSSRLDSIVGLSVVVVALTMVLICGKICAILSTSAWLYLIPRLRPSRKPSRAEETKTRMAKTVDSESEVYKKRVVMEGLLERTRRNNLTPAL